MVAEAAIVVVTRSEPVERLRDLFRACDAQTLRCDVYVAAPEEDATAIRSAASDASVRVHHVANPGGGRSTGLNLAIAAAKSEIVCRLDARTRPPHDYVERCRDALRRGTTIGIFGGVQRPVPPESGLMGHAVAHALANPFFIGAPSYRRAGRSGPVDTVYLGAFRREQVLALGGYDERLTASEDFELAARYRTHGLVVWLDSELVHDYEPRASLPAVIEQYRAFGRAKTRFWHLTGGRPNGRQTAALVGVPTAAALLALKRRWAIPLTATAGLTLAIVDRRVQPSGRPVAVRALGNAVGVLLPVAWVAGVLEEGLRMLVSGRRRVRSSPLPAGVRTPPARPR